MRFFELMGMGGELEYDGDGGDADVADADATVAAATDAAAADERRLLQPLMP